MSESLAINLKALHAWYAKSHRDLPFRKTRDPYLIWVSEVMLQQTRVAAMLPKYMEFTRRFPDLSSLAAAPEADVLAAWQGLGYYSRARNLRKGAQHVLMEHDGRFPSSLQLALKIPGIGPYTAAAILSIALDQATAVLDGNVKRVLHRLLGLPAGDRSRTSAKPEVSDAQYASHADRLMQSRGKQVSPGDHNQAMMELGATICVPGRPDCARCPLREQCASFARDPSGEYAASLPPKKAKPKIIELQLDAHLVYNRRRDKLLLAREASSRFFRALWFFPYQFSGQVYFDPVASPGLAWLFGQDGYAERRVFAKGFRHSITHHRIAGRVVEGRFSGGERRALDGLKDAATGQGGGPEVEWRWVPLPELHEFVVSSLARKIETIVTNEATETDGLF